MISKYSLAIHFHEQLTSFAASIDASFPSELGFWWVFTPLKHYNTITDNGIMPEIPWHYIHMWGMHYLDLQVVAVIVLVLLTTLVLIPLVARRTRFCTELVAWISGSVGVGFAVILVGHGARYGWWLTDFAALTLIGILVNVFLRIVGRPLFGARSGSPLTKLN